MRVTRLQFRVAEMIGGPLILMAVDGLLHVVDGLPFMNEFMAGAVAAIFLLRGVDVLRAARHEWPEK